MNFVKRDKFTSQILGYNSYLAYRKITSQNLDKIKEPFFLTLKLSNNKHIKIKSKKIKIEFNSKLINFVRNFKKEQPVLVKCRAAQKKDIPQLMSIVKEKNLNSRFDIDKNLPKKFKQQYKRVWIMNYFKGKRGNSLFVSYKNNSIMGFILLIKKLKSIQIDLIQTSKKFREKKVASSLINFANNQLMKNNYKIIAGTKSDNLSAIKMYKKLKFTQTKKISYIYHLHNN